MMQLSFFSIDYTDGDRLGKLSVPLTDVADWLNFLATPYYHATIVSAEQSSSRVSIYFQSSEGLYLYLDQRLNAVNFPIAS